MRIPHHPVRFGIPHHPIVSDPDLSIVFHPRSPFVPTFRADIRRFNVAGVSWYGGGADLTPYYLFDDDATAFHGFYRQLCNEHDPDFSDDANTTATSSVEYDSKEEEEDDDDDDDEIDEEQIRLEKRLDAIKARLKKFGVS